MADELDGLQKSIVKALKPVKSDIAYIATVLREYSVLKKNYSSGKTLSEIVAPATPTINEKEKFALASRRVSKAISNIEELHGQLEAVEALIDLYFNEKYDGYILDLE
ncbi:hypothetical protein HZA97_01665 [Candidatus Woesearchaeota archaeon]|nr:hypothetical protein [Candidatus Woesearchaeota archaeon]